MRVVDLSQKVTAQYYDEEFSEWSVRSKTIADVLWDAIDENVDDISFDAVPVRHGKWILKWHTFYHENLPCCSECGKFMWSNKGFAYCPYCGAKMDGKEDFYD